MTNDWSLRPAERPSFRRLLGVEADDVQVVVDADVEIDGTGRRRRRSERVDAVVEFLLL